MTAAMRPLRTVARPLRALIADRKGATAVEYGLILALIVLAMLAGLTSLAEATTGLWNHVARVVVESSR